MFQHSFLSFFDLPFRGIAAITPGKMHNDPGESGYSLWMLFFPGACRQEGSFHRVQEELPAEMLFFSRTISFFHEFLFSVLPVRLHADIEGRFSVS
ncbi:hypothetical protein CEXT_523171 [Caerostris extrusa]|uniref:Uncharacterized protein n=1 Tax=Caerostris extrusa TaxID=172846 RepID=A0AAV4SDS2_CAEEX|nr:hypothetical protein CEXT_523171 [Caerostris extrusa]